MKKILAAKLYPHAIIPTRNHPNDAGLDFYAIETVIVPARSFRVVHTGITVEIPQGFVGILNSKSRNDYLMGAGVVDAGYQSEILVKVVNPYDDHKIIRAGEAICQMIVFPIVTPLVEEISLDEIHLAPTARAKTGGIVTQARRG